jgi:hypothetical protein
MLVLVVSYQALVVIDIFVIHCVIILYFKNV